MHLAGFKVADGTGRLIVNSAQNVLDGAWTVTGESPQQLTLYRR